MFDHLPYAPGYEPIQFTGTAAEFIAETIGDDFYCNSKHIMQWELPRPVMQVIKTPVGYTIQTAPQTYLRLTTHNKKHRNKTYRLWMAGL